MQQLLRTELSYVNKDFGYNHEIWYYNFRVFVAKSYKISEPRIKTLITMTLGELGKSGDFSPGHVVKIHEPLIANTFVLDGDDSEEYSDYKIEWYVPGND